MTPKFQSLNRALKHRFKFGQINCLSSQNISWLIVWCSMPFQQYFSYSAPIHAFLEFFQPVLCTIFFPRQWLLSQITIVKTTDSEEYRMNPVAVTNQSSERILAELGIEPATSSSQVGNATV